MRKRTSNKTLLIGGVAALVVLGGGGLYLATRGADAPPAPAAAEGEAGHGEEEGGHAEGEAGHAEEGEAEEGRVELTAAQIQAAGIVGLISTVVPLGLGVALLAVPDVLPALDKGELVRLVPRWYADAGDFRVYHAGRSPLPARTRAFVDFLVEVFRRDELAKRFAASHHG